jgi:hypothetical protein
MDLLYNVGIEKNSLTGMQISLRFDIGCPRLLNQ